MLFNRSKGTEIKSRRKNTKPISAHPVFVPTLAVWGAAVGGLGVYVLPQGLTARIAQLSPVTIADGLAHIAVAGIAAAIGAACMLLVAMAARRAAVGGSDEGTDDDVYTIDPAEELGSDSLDAPIKEDEIEFDEGYNPDAFNDFESEWVESDGEEVGDEPVEDAREDRPEPALADEPVETGRPDTREIETIQKLNGDLVRMEDELDSIARDFPAGDGIGDASKPGTAIEKLRAVPPQELSLVQMVERLAVAIHHRKMQGVKDHSIPQRDAQLAETLKALGRFTEDGFDNQAPATAKGDAAEHEVRDALSKLRDVRGAA